MYTVANEIKETDNKIRKLEYWIKSNSYNVLSNELKQITQQKLETLKAYRELLVQESTTKQGGI